MYWLGVLNGQSDDCGNNSWHVWCTTLVVWERVEHWGNIKLVRDRREGASDMIHLHVHLKIVIIVL